MRAATIAFIFFFFNFNQLSAQSTVKIEGYVFTESGLPLELANVVVMGTGYGSATDASGYFSIENLFAGEYKLEARFLGYQTEIRKEIIVRKDMVTRVNFRLQPAVVPLTGVLIEAAKRGETSTFQEVISRNDIKASNAVSVGEILVHVPGVDVIDEGGGLGRKRVSIRGSNTNQVLVFLDGIPLNDPLIGDVDLSQVPLANVEEIRISKGGNSSGYGSGALGGVIEIISRKHTMDEIRLGGKFGRYGVFGIHPSLSGAIKNLDYFFNFEHINEDGNFPYTYDKLDNTEVHEKRLNAGFSSQNYFAKLNLDFGQHSWQLQANIYRSNRGLPGLVQYWTPFARADAERRIFAVRYTFKRGNLENHVRISQHLNRTEFLNDPPADAELRFRRVPAYHTKYQILSHRGEIKNVYKIRNKHSVLFQTFLQVDDFQDEDLLNGTLGPIRAANNLNAGVVVRNEWNLPKPAFLSKAVLTHALRFDFFSVENSQGTRKENQLSPRVGLLVSHSNARALSLRMNWGRSFRIPTFADLFYQDFRIRGNAELLSEKSWDFDSGVQIGLPLAGWLDLSGSYFRHKIENLIVWQLGSFANWQPFNANALLRGVEVGASWRLLQNRIELNLTHLFLNALNKNEKPNTHNKVLTYRPGHTTKIGLQLDFAPFLINYRRRVVDKRFVVPANTVSLPAYTVDDLTLIFKKEFNKLNFSFKTTIFNFFNERYEIVEGAPLPGRHWRAGIEVTY